MIAASTSYKRVPGWLTGPLCLILAWGCAADGGGSPAAAEAGRDAEDWGEYRAPGAGPAAARPAPETADWGEYRTERATPPPAGRPAAGEAARTTTWTIVLATFPNQGHQQAAANSVRQLPRIDAQLAGGAWVHTGAKGSLMAYGRYGSADSADAQRDLAWIKTLTVNDVPAFPRAMLTRVNLRPVAAGYDPLELMSARMRYPTVDPLYTLEVAVWGDFESGKLSPDRIRRSAEEYARTLRAWCSHATAAA